MKSILFYAYIIVLFLSNTNAQDNKLKINGLEYFETNGLNVFVFNNYYGLFNDEKVSGVEFIHHGVRTVTNGDVRLNNTPEQWDSIPTFINKNVDSINNSITAHLSYPSYNFNYSIKAEANGNDVILSVIADKPVPAVLEGKAGLNLEFLPSAYLEKSYLADGKPGTFPLYPSGPMIKNSNSAEPLPFAEGKTIVFAPEDISAKITVTALTGNLSLYDGRNKAQNGWYVLRTLLQTGKTGTLASWKISAAAIPGWIRQPVVLYSQLGYHPAQTKTLVLELDKNDTDVKLPVKIIKVNSDGSFTEVLSGEIKKWGRYLRYDYYTFDFTGVKETGMYLINYNGRNTSPFRIAEDIYSDAWHPTLDVYMPVQMDHMLVNEAYRVWHGASHLDDALQAPVNHKHFDLYAMGPTTDTKYKPGEHIPGLNIGGWFDAGDFDIRTQTHYAAVLNLVQIYERFGLQRDETTVNQKDRFVDLHNPDGKPDILQQIEHGTLALIAQHRAVGHAIPGIVEAHLHQYHHLGDAAAKTDNRIYDPSFDSLEVSGDRSGTFDDRWAFTTHTTPLNYGSAAALSAASRVLKGYNDKLAEECLSTAVKVWDDEHSHEPVIFEYGNTTGGQLDNEELKAAIELLITFSNKPESKKYSDRISALLNKPGFPFIFNASLFVRALPYMDSEYASKLKGHVKNYIARVDSLTKQNPFGVIITTGGWAGSGAVINSALTNYVLYKAFPDIIDREFVFRGLNYIYGCHPGASISLVSSVGTVSKKVAYGNNRADFTFIAGGIVPGVLIIKPDFPENKEDWPFFWGENEYVINLGPAYIYLVNAVNELLQAK